MAELKKILFCILFKMPCIILSGFNVNANNLLPVLLLIYCFHPGPIAFCCSRTVV